MRIDIISTCLEKRKPRAREVKWLPKNTKGVTEPEFLCGRSNSKTCVLPATPCYLFAIN